MSDRLTPEFWEQVKPIIVQMRGDGKSWTVIDEKIGISKAARVLWLRKHPELQNIQSKRKPVPGWRFNRAVEMWTKTNIGSTEIGRRLATTKNAICGMMYRAGLTPRSAHRVKA